MSILLNNEISRVEEKWLKTTLGFIKELFKNKGLSSHNHLHHFRVWKFARELLINYSESKGIRYQYGFVESLFFACIFHDSGLVRSIQEEHGKFSVQIFKEFISDNPIVKIEYYDELIKAIKLHDDKTYLNKKNGKSNNLYKFLTVSDDLDAFGALGLMRYFEIYTYRKVSYRAMSAKIRDNIFSRFLFVSDFLKFNKQIFNKHKNRFELSLYYLDNLSDSNVKSIVDSIKEGDFIYNKSLKQRTKIITDLIDQAIAEDLYKK